MISPARFDSAMQDCVPPQFHTLSGVDKGPALAADRIEGREGPLRGARAAHRQNGSKSNSSEDNEVHLFR